MHRGQQFDDPLVNAGLLFLVQGGLQGTAADRYLLQLQSAVFHPWQPGFGIEFQKSGLTRGLFGRFPFP